MITKYKLFKESLSSTKELEFNDDMMVKTSSIINLIDGGVRGNFDTNINKLSDVITITLKKDIIDNVFWINHIVKPFDIFNFFVTSFLTDDDIKGMFNNVVIHEGADQEDEYVSALEINGKIVLLLHSPERGSSIRIEDNNYTISFDEVLDIVKTLCEIINDKY